MLVNHRQLVGGGSGERRGMAEAGEDGEEVHHKPSWGFKFYPKSSEE